MKQKSKLSKLKKGLVYLFTNPRLIGIILLGKMSPLFPDKPYVELMYWLNMGKKLNLKNPVTFNEKLQWLKLYNHNPAYTVMVDKVKAKEYVAKLIGEEHIIPTLGVWDDPDDIDFDALPNQFVLKCNHNSGTGMCICRDKSKFHALVLSYPHVGYSTFPNNIKGIEYKHLQEEKLRQQLQHAIQRKHQRGRITYETHPQL